MNKAQQATINKVCYNNFDKALQEFFSKQREDKTCILPVKLRSCNAKVFETEHYYLLQSYSTIVACIDKATDTLYDLLRTEYGYTVTSAQHISKFEHDYCKGKWNCAEKFTARFVSE